jgi:hypothetical protein
MIHQRLLEALRKMRDEGVKYRDVGVCGNITRVDPNSEELDYVLENLMLGWPQAGSSRLFPVDGRDSYEYERGEDLLWVNPRRIELLNWLITSLEQKLNVA